MIEEPVLVYQPPLELRDMHLRSAKCREPQPKNRTQKFDMPSLCYLCRMLLRHELVRLVSKVAKNLGICLVFVTFFAVGCGDSTNGESEKQAIMLQYSDSLWQEHKLVTSLFRFKLDVIKERKTDMKAALQQLKFVEASSLSEEQESQVVKYEAVYRVYRDIVETYTNTVLRAEELFYAIKGLEKFEYLLDLADMTAAMSLEAYRGSASPFKKELHEIRPFEGSKKVAARMLKFLKGSENLQAHEDCERVQDPYSMRCVPQVHGASRNAFEHLKMMAETELNSVTDNPIVLSAEESISGGNFHGQLMALPLDYATLAAAELGNISDRRSYLLLEGKYGLPRLLTESSGLNSGFMIPQYTSAALVTENKTLCFPASADSIPTSLGQEDHVSMGSISGRKFNQVLGNLVNILAVELMFAAQGLEFRRPAKCSKIIEENFAILRSKVTKLEDDRLIGEDMLAIAELINERKFVVN